MLSFIDVSLHLAENKILDHVDWQIQSKERIALVGRNGAGKSSLLKLLQNELSLDGGRIQMDSGLRIAGLTQEVPITEDQTVYHFLVSDLGELGGVLSAYHFACLEGDMVQASKLEQRIEALHAWDLVQRVASMASRLKLDINAQINCLSGGMRRRALLAAALIAEPNLLLLDEPTNHLDMQSIEWLEAYLSQYSGTVLFVTHDRKFLSNLATRIVEIDRGKLASYACTYETYLDRREANRMASLRKDQLFDKRLQEEEVWIRQGVQARRTRNEGRVLRLKAMREAYRTRRNATGDVKSMQLNTSYSGKTVLEAHTIYYAVENTTLIRDFSFVLTRGDKVGIVGPNGCGKTTLIRLLMGELTPDSGQVKQGSNLEVAYFDQLRQQLQENDTVMNNVADGADYVTLNGHKKHVASYLQDFLFSQERLNQPVFSLSGGERNRLLLAKILAKPVNFLVMDEPTNDLDIETLELLESILLDYTGTLLLISHDREFLDQVVSSVLVYEEHGKINEFIGSYSDYQTYQKNYTKKAVTKPKVEIQNSNVKPASNAKLSYHEKRELEQLPKKIEQLEQHVQSIHQRMALPEFYQQAPEAIVQTNTELANAETSLEALYARWEALEEK